jgi:protein-arginine kinase activator protein McsA
MHKGTRHVGKTPQSLRQGRDLADRLKQLQKKLDRAVNDEDFEQAAHLRDEIRNTRDQIEHVTPGVKP